MIASNCPAKEGYLLAEAVGHAPAFQIALQGRNANAFNGLKNWLSGNVFGRLWSLSIGPTLMTKYDRLALLIGQNYRLSQIRSRYAHHDNVRDPTPFFVLFVWRKPRLYGYGVARFGSFQYAVIRRQSPRSVCQLG